jgi:hypothetical protein
VLARGQIISHTDVECRWAHRTATAWYVSDVRGSTISLLGRHGNTEASYLNAILLENEQTRKKGITAAMIHPPVITNPDRKADRQAQGQSTGPFSQPYSLACQIPGDDARGLAEFNEMTETIRAMGYVYGDGNPYEPGSYDTWVKGDSIDVHIKKKAK